VLGRAVAQVRHERGVAAAELAVAAGVELTVVQALEAGRLDPPYELLVMLAQSLGVRPSAFVIRAEALAAQGSASGEAHSHD
jgi:transcriptional regulator with XRE-family HTH domain